MYAALTKYSFCACTENYWEFVRLLRMDEHVEDGFVENVDINPEQQKRYMAAHSHAFFIAITMEPGGLCRLRRRLQRSRYGSVGRSGTATAQI